MDSRPAALTERLAGDGTPRERLALLKAPAGLDTGAITPEEIALAILSEIGAARRRGQRIAGQSKFWIG